MSRADERTLKAIEEIAESLRRIASVYESDSASPTDYLMGAEITPDSRDHLNHAARDRKFVSEVLPTVPSPPKENDE